jgi:hypothetical protein
MTSLWQLPVVVTALFTWLATAPTSIGDAAYRESLRRQLTAKSVRAYTNRDLPQVSFAPPPDRPARVSSTAGDDVVEVKMEKHDEKWWRDRMAAVRADLDRDETLSEAVQTRINSLTNDIVNRDDPFQQAALREQLQKAVAELDRLQQAVLNERKTIDTLQDQARRLGLPAGWVR